MRKTTSFLFGLVAVILVASLILSGCSSNNSTNATNSAPASGGTIKIGYISSLSGPFAGVADFCTPAAQMVIDQINTAGGLLGKQVELVIRDDQGDPSVVGQKADELKGAGCVAILGCLLDPNDAALNNWSKTSHVPVILTSSTAIDLRTTNYNKYSFMTVPISLSLASLYAKWVAGQNINSVIMVGADMAIPHDIYNNFWPDLHAIKPNVTDLGVTFVSGTEMDFTNNINSILSKKPDLFLSGIAGPPWPSFVQQAQRFDFFTKTKTLGTYLLGSELTTPFGKSYPTGIESSTWSPFYDTSIPAMKAFSDAYLAKTKLYPADLTMIRYVSALAITQAIKQANSTDPDKIVAAMESIKVTIPTGTIHYNSYHQANLPIFMVTSGYSDAFPIAVGLNPTMYQDDVYPTADQLKALNP